MIEKSHIRFKRKTERHDASNEGVVPASPPKHFVCSSADAKSDGTGLDTGVLNCNLRDALAIASIALARVCAGGEGPASTQRAAAPVSSLQFSRAPLCRFARENKAGPARHAAGMNRASTIIVYCAGCEGLQRLASEHRTALFKIGSTTGSLRTRLAELSVAGYAARGGTSQVDMTGFDDWVSVRIVARQSMDRAICVTRNFIKVTLPETMPASAFEAQLRAALYPFTFEGASENLIARSGGRWTANPTGSCRRATEIYEFRPREDGDGLVSIIEGILEAARILPTPANNRQSKGGQKRGRSDHHDDLWETEAGTHQISLFRKPMAAAQVAAMQARLRNGTRGG